MGRLDIPYEPIHSLTGGWEWGGWTKQGLA